MSHVFTACGASTNCAPGYCPEALVVPLEEYRALKALEQREAELYWAVHEARYPSRPGDDVPDGKVYDSMDALLAATAPLPRRGFAARIKLVPDR